MKRNVVKMRTIGKRSWRICRNNCATVTKAWSATKAIVAISKWKEAATLLSMKTKSKPKSVTTAPGCYGLTPPTMPRQWLTSIRHCGRSRTFSVPPNRSLRQSPIYHKRDVTIRGHAFCSFLTLGAQAGIGEPDETSPTGIGMERGHSWAGCFAAG